MNQVLIIILAISSLAAGYRLIRGPSAADRLLALDLMMILLMGFFTILFISSGEIYYLELVMIVALVAFVSTIAFCRALQGKRKLP